MSARDGFMKQRLSAFTTTLCNSLQDLLRNYGQQRFTTYSPHKLQRLPQGISDPASPTYPAADDIVTDNGESIDCGSFVDSDDECKIEEVSEPIERYADGMYYPICIGDILAGAYRVVHKLDSNSGSLLWDIGDIDEYSPKMAYEIFGRPRKARLWATLWKRGELVDPIRVNETMLRGNIHLADFGSLMKSSSPVTCKWQSLAVYCAPERFHNMDPSFASDMWSYMCLFAELYLGFIPFLGRGNHTVLTKQVHTLGPLPLQWADRYDGGDTPDGPSLYDQTRTPTSRVSLEALKKRARPDIADAERKLVLSVFSKVFTYLPENRFDGWGIVT